jgi:hypothetical protein
MNYNCYKATNIVRQEKKLISFLPITVLQPMSYASKFTKAMKKLLVIEISQCTSYQLATEATNNRKITNMQKVAGKFIFHTFNMWFRNECN